MKKRILGAFLAVCLLLTLLPAALAADPLRVLDASGGAVAPDADGKYQLTSGSYTVTGDGDAPIVVSGDVELTLHGAVITRPTAEVGKFGPAIDIQRGSAVLTLTGTNRVTGSPGFAGVYVAEGASVTITGTGSLTATGGAYYFDRPKHFCGGAGIGGNGFGVRGDGMEIYRYPNFGTINIAGGTVRRSAVRIRRSTTARAPASAAAVPPHSGVLRRNFRERSTFPAARSPPPAVRATNFLRPAAAPGSALAA